MHKKYCIGLVFLLIITCTASFEKPSGLYIDNGLNQTILHKVSSRQQKWDIQRKLLNILELPDIPKRIVRRSLKVKRSAPKFLLNIYKNVLTNNTDTLNPEDEETKEFNLSIRDIDIIVKSDLIMTFSAHNPHSGNASRINRGKRIWFDVSEVPRDEHIIAAELRLYQGSHESDIQNTVYTITIYRVARTMDGGRVKHYIDSTNTTIGKEGWITLNIIPALKYWVKYPKENRGLFVAVRRVNYTGHIIRPTDIGIIGVFGIPDKQPFMVGFFKNPINYKKHDPVVKQKRDIKRDRQHFNSLNIQRNSYTNYVIDKSRDACNIKTLYINFKDLEWQDWIIAPEGYDAYYCSGECNFPLNNRMNTTNHAVVQALIHLKNPHKIPKPCCTPTKLSPISVLYFLDDSNVVLKKYKNMVIDSCGCH